jgi:hypothetical protein
MTGTGFAEAAAQIRGQQELAGAEPLQGQAPADVGQQAVAAGAAVTHVDTDELLAYIRDLQGRVEAVEAERAAEKKAGVPSVVAWAEQIASDLAGRHAALSANKVLGPAVEKAGKLVEIARAAAESGDGTALAAAAQALSGHLGRVASAASSADISYAQQIAAEHLPDAIAELKAPPPSMLQGQVVSRRDAPPPRRLYSPVG